jgi:hypothetical protein
MSETWTPVTPTPETWTAVQPTEPEEPPVIPDPEIPAPVCIADPQITGIFDIFQTLTVSNGIWTDAVNFTRQWLLNGAPILNATGATYAVKLSDRLGVISCTVTATGPGGSASKTSSTISPAVRYSALPVIS